MDKRNEKSKEAIKQALIRLSREKSYTEISIRDLCREAGVSRSTFYNNYHFFNDVITEMSEEFMQRIQGRRLSKDFFDFVIDNSDELKLLLESGVFGREFSMYLKNIIAEDMRQSEKIRQGEKPRQSEDLSLNVLTLYHAYGLFGVLLNLIENAKSPAFEEIYQESVNILIELMKDFSVD